jgi:superfamily II DNA/RNA helicase
VCRELAVQIDTEFGKFCRNYIRHTVLYGGVPKAGQIRDLRNRMQIVIATPGRLIGFAVFFVLFSLFLSYGKNLASQQIC